MNGRVVTAIIGVITLILGGYGISYPQRVLQWVGLDTLTSNPQAGLAEARAVYGGFFIVLGIFTLWAAIDPRRHRGQLTLLGCLWLGLFAGRMAGIVIDGNSGILNNLAAAFEAIIGGLLLAAPYLTEPGDEVDTEPVAGVPEA